MNQRLLIVFFAVSALTACKGVKYCENQQYDYLNAEFKPCKAETATYKQSMISAEGRPMHSRGNLTSAESCPAAVIQNTGAELLNGIKDNLKEGTRRVYENGKLKFEILPSKEKKQILVLNEYSAVSETNPYYRSWFFDDTTGKVKMMRVNFLGNAQGHHEDFSEGMLEFEKFNSYAGGVKREVRIAFDHSEELENYLTTHGNDSSSWLSQKKSELKKKTNKIEAKAKKKEAKDAAKRLKELKKLDDKVKK